MPTNEWLKAEHPIYVSSKNLWTANERRLEGGLGVLKELKRFEWEVPDFEESPDTGAGRDRRTYSVLEIASRVKHYTARQNEASYINFPDMFATVLVGQLLRQAPQPGGSLNFGTLGEVPRERNVQDVSNAELVYYNVDGVGNDGSQWDSFWAGVMKRAMATGHRWIYVDSPATPSFTREQVLNGIRPYLVEFSPLDVINWGYENGRLGFAILKAQERNPRVREGKLENNDPTDVYLLMTRRGFTNFGPEFAGGGWWKFDDQGELLSSGNWNSTKGEIPLFSVYYERRRPTKDNPHISKPGTTELGNVAVSYMNLTSAADFDAWDAASSIQWIVGVEEEGFNLAMDKIVQGTRFVPVPINTVTETTPQVVDGSTGAVVAGVFTARLTAKREEARELAALEATSMPDSSGTSKRAGFSEVKAPRLALLASELETAQNIAIHFLELRFSGGSVTPTGSVRWPRNFELLEVVDRVQAMFSAERLSGYRSATLGAKAMTALAVDKGMIGSDEEFKTISAEYEDSAKTLTDAIKEGRIAAPDIGEGGIGSVTGERSSIGANGRFGSPNRAAGSREPGQPDSGSDE